MITAKKCTICKQVKPISEFYKDKRKKDGLYSKCKKCHAVLVNNWQSNNKEKFREICKLRKRAHPEEGRAYSKLWAAKNPELKIQNERKWRQQNPDYGKNWRKNNLDKIRNYAQIRRARIESNGGNLTVEEWHTILEFYGHRCLRCGRTDVKLTIDHVLPIFLGGTHSIDNVQPLCGPCNSSKRYKHIDYRKEIYHETTSS